MNLQEKIKQMPRVPIFVYVTCVFLTVLGLVWLSADAKMALSGSVSGNNQVPTLAPLPAPANYVDRSGDDTMRVDGFTGQLDPDILMLGGTSTIQGRVVRPGGNTAMQRATVELARWEGERYNTMRITTDFDGSFEVKDLRGGRWSGRGWEPPRYPSREAAAWFISASETLTVELTTGEEVSKELRVSVSPQDSTYDEFTLTVFAVDRAVDERGRLVDLPMTGPVAVSWPFNYSASPIMNLVDGVGTTVARCLLTNPPLEIPRRGTVKIEKDTLEFFAPLCVERPEPTTTTTLTPPTIGPTTTTSTTSTTLPTTTTTIKITIGGEP
jgi:hypothetical protein